jgi:TetR/AcrR family transcriptional regulator, cholesterol catabolism regulator
MKVIPQPQTPETGTASRRERKRLETQQRLIHAAIALISEKGLFDVKVEEITERADVGKGTFFNYFPSKEHLLASLFAFKREQVAAAAEMMRQAKEVKTMLKRFVHMAINDPKRTPTMVQSIFSAALVNPAVKEPFCALINEGRNTICVALERGQELGEVRKDIPAVEMAKFFQQVLFGTQGIWAMSDPGSSLEERIDLAFEIFWRGIAAQPAPADRGSRRSK